LPTDDVLLEKVRIKIRNLKDSSNDTQKELLESISQHCATSAENIDFKVSSKADISKQTINCMLPKRFKYVFHDKCDSKY
jgi:septum formation topological specificity factor MinE